jgi:hypothetical protein
MKQLENGIETHKVYLKIFDMYCINYSADINEIFEFFRVSAQLWPTDFGCGL